MFNKNKSSKTKLGFTLAEVLITIVIIGVVASLTVTTLMTNTGKHETISKIKKSYSTLAQAMLRSKNDNGPIEEWYDTVNQNSTEFYNRFFHPYFSSSKICNNHTECGYNKSRPWKMRDGQTYEWDMTRPADAGKSRIFMYLADGSFIAITTGYYPCVQWDEDGKCTGLALTMWDEPRIIFDTNGPKQPNMFGKDVFLADFSNERGVVPYCSTAELSVVNQVCSSSGSGSCCLRKLIEDGWEFKEDYPI